jgi:chromosome segregation ATPase
MARLVLGQWSDLPIAADTAVLIVGALIAVVCLACVLLMTVRALIRSSKRRHPEPETAMMPSALADASLVTRLDEARRELAARNEHLAFVRELLQTRTRETERLVDERVTVVSNLTEARADAERWQAEHARIVAELQAERSRFAGELSRLSDELLRGTLDANRRADDLIEAQRELARRKEEIEALRAEVMSLRAEVPRLPAVNAASSTPTPIAPPAPRRWRSR